MANFSTASLTWTDSSTGHTYGFYQLPKSWADANAFAQSIGGYLVKIDSAAENASIYSRVSSSLPISNSLWYYNSYAMDGGGSSYFWLGANDAANEGAWKWAVDNGSLTYSNWGTGPMWSSQGTGLTSEPDNFQNQDYLAMAMESWPYGSGASGLGSASYWNDLKGENNLYFVVEADPVADVTPPTVASYSPADGNMGAPIDGNISINFSEAIQRGTGATGIQIRSGSATGTVVESFDVASSSRISISGSTLTIDPTNSLTNSTQYYVTFAAGSIRDAAGNSYAGTTSYDFTTVAAADVTPPTVASYSPADGNMGAPIDGNISINFSEAIQRGTGATGIQIRSGSATGTVVESFDVASSSRISISGSTLTIDPTNSLTNSTQYYVTFAAGSIRDAAGNSYAGTTSYDFTTVAAANVLPTVNTINGSVGNDSLVGTTGNDFFIGGLGVDTAIVSYTSSNISFDYITSPSTYYALSGSPWRASSASILAGHGFSREDGMQVLPTSDGGYYVATTSGMASSNSTWLVLKFNSNGQLDSRFSNDGILEIRDQYSSTSQLFLSDAVVDSANNLYLYGTGSLAATYSPYLVWSKVKSDGSLTDISFNNINGAVTYKGGIGNSSSSGVFAGGITLGSDGNLYSSAVINGDSLSVFQLSTATGLNGTFQNYSNVGWNWNAPGGLDSWSDIQSLPNGSLYIVTSKSGAATGASTFTVLYSVQTPGNSFASNVNTVGSITGGVDQFKTEPNLSFAHISDGSNQLYPVVYFNAGWYQSDPVSTFGYSLTSGQGGGIIPDTTQITYSYNNAFPIDYFVDGVPASQFIEDAYGTGDGKTFFVASIAGVFGIYGIDVAASQATNVPVFLPIHSSGTVHSYTYSLSNGLTGSLPFVPITSGMVSDIAVLANGDLVVVDDQLNISRITLTTDTPSIRINAAGQMDSISPDVEYVQFSDGKILIVKSSLAANQAIYVQRGTGIGETLTGSAFDDEMYGNGGDDVLVGGIGMDTLSGGAGNNIFRLVTAEDSNLSAFDQITDFKLTDKVDFLGMQGVRYAPNLFGYRGSLAATVAAIQGDSGIANQVIYFTDSINGYLYVKGSGSGVNFDGSLVQLNGVLSKPATLQVPGANDAPAISSNGNFLVYASNSWTQLTSAALNTVLSVTDVNGDAITQYRIANTTAGANHLQLYVGGAVLNPGQTGIFTAAQLASGQVYYNGISAGTDTLSIAAFDGQDWGTAASFTVRVRGADTPTAIISNNVKAVAEDRMSGGTALTTLLSMTDVDGDAVQGLQLYDAGANNGYFTVNGVVQASGTLINISSADVSSVKYVASTTMGGAEALAVKAYDGLLWSDWFTWNQVSGSNNNSAPVINIQGTLSAYVPNSWTQLTSAALNTVLSVTDVNGDAITQYRIANTTAGANHLQLYVGGAVLNPGQTGIFTAAQLASGQVYYNGISAGTDTLSIAAFDGQDWGTAASFTVRVRGADTPTAIISNNVKAVAEDRMSGGTALTTLLSMTDVDGDAVQGLQLYDAGANNGYFTVNGVVQASGTLINISSADVSSVKYVASTTMGGAEALAVKAYDGLLWSDWFTWNQVSGSNNNSAPVINIQGTLSAYVPNSWTQLTSAALNTVLSVTDVNGDAITQYRIANTTAGANHLQLYVGGAVLNPGQTGIFTAAQLASGQVYYNGISAGTDTLSIAAFDGQDWGTAASFTVRVRGADTPTAIISNNVKAVAEDRMSGGTALTTLLSMTDVDGDAVQGLQLYDAGANNGYFTVNGVVQASGTLINISSADVSSVKYVASTTMGGAEALAVKAYDGLLWSDWFTWNQVSGSNNNSAPVINIQGTLSAYVPNSWTQLTSAALNTVLSVTDVNGDAITQYRIANTTAGANHLQLYVGGAVLNPGQTGIFTAAQLASGQVYYNGISAGTDTLSIAAFDGQDWGTAASFTVRVRGADNVAVVSSNNVIAQDISGGVALSDLVSITDDDSAQYGDTLQQIQIYDSGSNNGYFTYVLNGQLRSVAAATPVTLTDSAQIASVKYVASSALGSSEPLAIKTYDGLLWSDWQTWNQVSGRLINPIDTSPAAPALAPLPFTLKAVSGVASWQVIISVTPVGGAPYTLTQIIRQDSPTVILSSNSNPNITFDINADLNSGDSVVVTARGYSGANATGSVVASSAQLSMSSGFGFGVDDAFTSSLSLKLLSLNNYGVVTGLPASFNGADKTLYILVEAPGTTGYGIDSLSRALSAHQVLLQYAAAGQVGIVGLADVVDPMAYSNPVAPSVRVNGVVIPVLPGGGTIDNWGALAFKSPSNANVKVMVSSDNGSQYYQSNQFSLSAGQSETNGAHLLFQTWNNGGVSNGLVTNKVYFADVATGNPISGLQMAILPASGKILSSSDWLPVDSYNSPVNSLTTYTGSVSEILNVTNIAASNSLFYIIDTAENISAVNSQIYNLVMSGRLVGATPTDGFGHIAMSSNSGDTYLTVSDGDGHTAYLRADRGQSSGNDSIGQRDHAVLAIKTSATSAVTVYVDGAIYSTLSDVNGIIGYTLPSDIALGTHTITVSASSGTAQIGIVPPGGGFPASYSSSLGLWVGTAAQLPTSLNSIVANTLYVVSDTAANIVGLDGGVAVNTGVINALANSGYLAFNSTTSMSWAQYQQITQATNYPIASVSSLLISDSVYALGQHIYDTNANQQFAIRDNAGHLLSSKFASAAKKISQGQTDSTLSEALKNAVDNHRITWSDSLSSLLDDQTTSAMSSYYYNQGQLAGVQATDNIINLAQLSSPHQISKLTQFVNEHANGKLTIDIRDSIANVYSTLTGAGAAAFESKLASVFNQVDSLSTRVEINDTVANLKAAYDAGKIATLSNIAQHLFDDVNPGAANTGLGIRVTDTVANITSFLNNTSYANLMGKVSAFIVSDTAANIVDGLNTQDNSWDSATTSANAIVVKDTYANIQQYASTLFSAQNNNSVVTKIVFTDVTGATSPIVIGANYSYNGQMPQFDFSQAKGLQGVVTVTETILDQAQVNAAGTGGAWGNSGIALTIKDSAGHQIVINVLSNGYSYNGNPYNPDPELLGLNSVILPGEPFMAPSPIASPTPVPEVSGQPILIQGNSAVASWSFTVNHYSAAGALLDTQTYNVKQDASGANIAFGPNLGGPGVVMSPADYYSFSATGLNASGAAIATGQIGLNKPTPTFSSTFYLNFPTIDSAGNIANLWAYTPNSAAILVSNLGLSDNYSYSLDTLTTALTNNANLARYAANYQLGVVNLAGTVQPAGLSSQDPWISINGLSIWSAGGGVGAWNPMAIKSTYATTVVQHVSFDGGATYQSTQWNNVGANTPTELDQWTWQLSNDINTLKTIKVYFTDTNNNPVSGLQVAIPPVATGGMIAAGDWINVGGGSSEPITIYSGSVSQILGITNPAVRSVFYIKDTIEHIQSGGDALYNLVQAGKILGSTVTNGFSAIARASTGDYSSTAVTNSTGQVAYVHSTENGIWAGAQEHAVLAVRASAGTAVPIYIDGQLATTLVAESSGVTALVLPKLFVAGLSTGLHTISLGAGAQVGVVPPGGGWPASYGSSLSIWTGKAAQLPTSISSIVPNTVYILNDTAANIVALDGYAAVATEVLSALAATGYLAYNSTTSMTWSQVHQLQQTDNNFAISNISNTLITDSIYAIDNHFWDLNAGQALGVRDSMSRLLSSPIAQASQKMSSGAANNVDNYIWSSSLREAFNNHQVNWVDNLATVNNVGNLNAMKAVYYGSNGQLASAMVRDTVANWTAIVSSSQVSNLVNFVNNNASTQFTVNIQDTAANIYNALVGSNPAAFEAALANAFAGVGHLSSQVQINDSVANLKTYAAYMGAIDTVASSFFTNVNASATNLGLSFRVTDTVANIDSLLVSGTYTAIASKVTSYIVVDTAANLVNAFGGDNWASATDTANNIIVHDTFNNIKNNAATLFSQSNNNNVEVTKINFTDLTGASASSPLVIKADYSWNGQMPQLDFTKAGLFTGPVTITESILTSSQISNLGYLASGAQSGVMLRIADAYKEVVVDVLSNRTFNGVNNPDPMNADSLSVLLNSANTKNRVFSLAAGNTGTPSETAYQSILNWGANDKINFTNLLSAANTNNNSVANIGQAKLNASGLAEFSVSDDTLSEQINAVAKAIQVSGVGTTGKMAYWGSGNDTYVLIEDGVLGTTPSAGDNLVKLVGTTSHVALQNGVLGYV